jgi:hypothetical protein
MIYENSYSELLDNLLLEQQEIICGGIKTNEVDSNSEQFKLKDKDKEKDKIKIFINFMILQKANSSPVEINLSM